MRTCVPLAGCCGARADLHCHHCLPFPPGPQVYNQPQYAGVDLPFDIYTLAILNSLLMGGVELFRNSELDPERRIYPGGEHWAMECPAVMLQTCACHVCLGAGSVDAGA